MERFEPTHRDLARLNGAVAQRGADLRQLVNSLKRLNVALAAKQPQIVQLIDSSETGVRRVRVRGQNVSRAVARPAEHAQPDDRDARQGAGVRQAARAGGHEPAARPPTR